ncbi:MAG: M50 family metallopeptidase [Eubacteriales bacterium]|nr:M50 family metallopeptidase [Eubacteriales bacterium]
MSVLFAIALFSVLILVHELGHFAAAKLSGVQVNEFSMFMGPVLFQKKLGETLYSIRLIPLGGFCAMEGEDGGSESPRSFDRAAWWKRLVILVSGAAMNFLLGAAMLLAFTMPVKRLAVPEILSFEDYATVSDTLQPGDVLHEIDGERVYVYSDVSLLLRLNPGEVHDLVVVRNGQKLPLDNVLLRYHETEAGQKLGINFATREVTFADRLDHAWNLTRDTVRIVGLSLKMLLTGQAGLKDMSGPVGIVQQMSLAAEAAPSRTVALMNFLYFGGFIGINLAVMNLLPIPALDGGRVVGLLITTAVEAATGKKINPKYEGWLHGAGMMALFALMGIIMFKDIIFLFK